jgi:atypical dual specificity phosphatase
MAPPDPHELSAAGDALPLPHADCYWIWPGRFLAGAHAGSHVEALLTAGIDCFVDLTHTHHPVAPYATALPAHARWHGFAITDYAVPGRTLMRDIVDAIDTELARGARLYLHCHAGVGRTGTAVGCWLVEHGLDGAAALALIARKRAHLPGLALMPHSPETAAQRAFVRDWRGTERA